MAAPQINGAVTTATGGGANNLSVNHTVAGALVNSELVVLINNSQFSAADSVSFNGVALTQLPVTSGNFWTAAYYLPNPPSGTHSVIVTWPIIANDMAVAIMTLTDAGVPKTPVTRSGFGTTPSNAVTTTTDDTLLIDFLMSETTSHTQGAGQTQQSNITSGAYRQTTATKAVAVAGASSMSATLGADVNWQMTTIPVPPPGGGFTPQLLII